MHGVNQDCMKYKQQIELLQNEKQNLEKGRSSLLTQVEDKYSEVEKVKNSNVGLQRQVENLEDEKVVLFSNLKLFCL